MFEITTSARKRIREIAGQEKTPSPIRIMMAGGCTASRLGILFDSIRQDDKTFEIEGIRYVISQELLSRFQPITVDYAVAPEGSGFFISPGRDIESLSP